jgi:hypothetical protein
VEEKTTLQIVPKLDENVEGIHEDKKVIAEIHQSISKNNETENSIQEQEHAREMDESAASVMEDSKALEQDIQEDNKISANSAALEEEALTTICASLSACREVEEFKQKKDAASSIAASFSAILATKAFKKQKAEAEMQDAAETISACLLANKAVEEFKRQKAAAFVIATVMRVNWARAQIRLEKEAIARRKQEMELKRLRNEAINSKGLIRAFCRVKPFLGGNNDNQSVVKVEDGSNTLVLLDPQGLRSKAYLLDHVFVPETSQEQVYAEVEELVDSALDGNQVCILAYGQTGSGKSYTMEGTADHPGLIPRAALKLFDGSRAKEGWKLSFKTSSFQIYQNKIQDLLVPGSGPTQKDMMATGKNCVEIRDLTKVKISSDSISQKTGKKYHQFFLLLCGRLRLNSDTFSELMIIEVNLGIRSR